MLHPLYWLHRHNWTTKKTLLVNLASVSFMTVELLCNFSFFSSPTLFSSIFIFILIALCTLQEGMHRLLKGSFVYDVYEKFFWSLKFQYAKIWKLIRLAQRATTSSHDYERHNWTFPKSPKVHFAKHSRFKTDNLPFGAQYTSLPKAL